MTAKPCPFRLQRGYQLIAKLSVEQYGLSDTFTRVSNILYSWARISTGSLFHMPMTTQSASLNDNNTGTSLGIILDGPGLFFSIRLFRLDSAVAGRTWVTEAEVYEANSELHFATRVQISSPGDCEEPLPRSRPDFVVSISKTIGLIDFWPVSDMPWELVEETDVEAFTELLDSPERRLPVVLVTECSNQEDSFFQGYPLDAAALAKELLGAAHVARIPGALTYYLTQLVGRSNTAFDGSVRTYYPGYAYTPGARPFATKWDIQLSFLNASVQEPAYPARLADTIFYRIGAQLIDWTHNGFQFYLTAQQARLEHSRGDRQTLDELKASFSGEIEQLRTERAELLALSAAYAEELDECKASNDELRKRLTALQTLADAYRARLASHDSKSSAEVVPTDWGYTNMENWAEQYFPDRLYLHPRAIQALKGAIFENSELVYQCLILLATDYRELRQGLITRAEFEDRCRSVDPGLEESGSISDIGAGAHGSSYFINYDGRSRKLNRHLAKGGSRDPKYCMRIYFLWDDENQIVVIGSLPQHLENGLT